MRGLFIAVGFFLMAGMGFSQTTGRIDNPWRNAEGSSSGGTQTSTSSQSVIDNPLGGSTSSEVTVEVPRVHQGASKAFETAVKTVCGSIDQFYRSPVYREITWIFLSMCFLLGLTWRARGLMWGEEDINAFVTWILVRIFFGMGCFFFLAPTVARSLTRTLNETTEYMALHLAPSKTGLLPGVQARLQSLFDANDVWLQALTKKVEPKVKGEMTDMLNDDSKDAFFKRHPEFVEFASFEATLLKGFPGLNYGVEGGVYPSNHPFYTLPGSSSFVPPKPSSVYEDKYNLYANPETSRSVSRFGQFSTRPLISSLESSYGPLYSYALTLNGKSTEADFRKFEDEVLIYQAKMRAIRATYLRDYAAWRLYNANPWERLIGVEGANQTQSTWSQFKDQVKSGSLGDAFKSATTGGLSAFLQTRVEPSEAIEFTINDLEQDVADVKENAQSGVLRGLLVPLALGIVGFYVAITVWSLPIGLALWSAFFFLPKELELSGVLKKSFGTILVLLFIPVFSNLVVQIALSFVDAVQVASVETALAQSISVATSAFAASSLVPGGLGPVSLGAKLGVGLVAGAGSATSDVNIFTIGAWVVAFLFIIATPRIVSSIVFGTGSLAETLLQKIPVGAGMSTMLTMAGARSVAGASANAPQNMQSLSRFVGGGTAASGPSGLGSSGSSGGPAGLRAASAVVNSPPVLGNSGSGSQPSKA